MPFYSEFFNRIWTITRNRKRVRSGENTFKRNSGKRVWTCKTCDEEFDTRKSLTHHRNEVHLQPYRITQIKYLYSKADGTYTCNTCDAETNTQGEMEAHVVRHEEKYTCSECGDAYSNVQKLSLHMKTHWDDDLYRCPLCKYNTPRRSCMSIHINTTHFKQYLYYCQYCGKGFHDPLIYKEHENIHLGGEPVTCIVCQKKFSFTRNLISHQIRNHKVMILGVQLKNQCPVCRKCYSKAITLENHMKQHDKSKPRPKTHLCDTCGKGFAQKGKLILHYRVHTGYKPHKCSYCEKSFTKRDYLVMHERIHSGEKPYRCVYCGKCFNQDASLRIHVRSHTGERPYVCQICQHGFVSKAALKVHLNNCSGI